MEDKDWYKKLGERVSDKFRQDLPFEALTEDEKEWIGCELRSKGIRSDLVYSDKFPILKCLLYHLENRDDWMKQATAQKKELDKLKSSWYFKFTSKLSQIRERLKQS